MSDTEELIQLEDERDLAIKGCDTLVDYSAGLIKDTNMRASFKKSNLWKKKELTVGFLPWKIGDTLVKADDWMKKWVIKVVAEQLQPIVGIQFIFDLNEDNGESCDIRITFDKNLGAYSLLGNQSSRKDQTRYKESMNLGWLDAPGKDHRPLVNETSGKGKFVFQGGEVVKVGAGNMQNYGNDTGSTIIHEFGHALGMIHEHQNPTQLPFLYDVKKLNAKFSGPPNNWNSEQIKTNITFLEDASEFNSSNFDDLSIMKYSYDPELLIDIDMVDKGEIIVKREAIRIPEEGIKIHNITIENPNIIKKENPDYLYLLAKLISNEKTEIFEPKIKWKDIENGNIFVNISKLKLDSINSIMNDKDIDKDIVYLLEKLKKTRQLPTTDYKKILKYLLEKNIETILSNVITANDILLNRVSIRKPENVLKNFNNLEIKGKEVRNMKELLDLSESEYKTLIKNILLEQTKSINKVNLKLSDIDKEWIGKMYPYNKEKPYKTLINIPGKLEQTVEFDVSKSIDGKTNNILPSVPSSSKSFSFPNISKVSSVLSNYIGDYSTSSNTSNWSSYYNKFNFFIILVILICFLAGFFLYFRYRNKKNKNED
jgi:hypothetical protein